MKRNLSSLQRKAAAPYSSRSKRTKRQITRAARQNNRDRKNERQANLKRNSLFGDTKNSRRRQQRAERDLRAWRKQQAARDLRKKRRNQSKRRVGSTEKFTRKLNTNTVRTMCVRTCDGYFFPVNFSTNKQSIIGDASACNNLCPGTEMKLYYNSAASQNNENMISAENSEPYTSLPTAFAYQKSYNPGCSCNYRLLDRQEASVPKAVTKKRQRETDQRIISRIARPNWRIDRGQDPETLDTVRGGLTAEAISELDPDQNTDKQVAQNRKIRVIGDAYFPTQ